MAPLLFVVEYIQVSEEALDLYTLPPNIRNFSLVP